MACGLFGKLAAKRDFITLNVPGNVLLPWEKWMQTGLASSRHALGPGWLDAYLKAPLWRFWLGASLCGQPVVGVLMPSIDGVGRHFPLTVFSLAPPEARFALTGDGTHEDWFVQAEDFLLSTLDAGEDFAATTSALEVLPDYPSTSAALLREPGGAGDLMTVRAAGETELPDALGGLARAMDARAREGMSFFWTIGGGDFHPLALAATGMPRPEHMQRMLVAGLAAPDHADGEM